MKFIIDQNLPPRLARVLQGRYPGSQHVIGLQLDRARDHVLWRYCKENEFSIMTRDDDFQQLSMLHGAPPKVVFMENAQGDAAGLAQFVQNNLDSIDSFMQDAGASLLILRG
jgi:predicted nuclease of predicted toxin-antitoxin system